MLKHVRLTLDGKAHDVTVSGDRVSVDGHDFEVRVEHQGPALTVLVDGRPFKVELLSTRTEQTVVRIGDSEHAVVMRGFPAGPPTVTPPVQVARHLDAPGSVTAPMSGRILRVAVKAGDAVQTGDLLLILEAMKMENEIRSPRAGMVNEVAVQEGERVAEHATLFVIV
jgi:glutaconyl-CoA/methylmalonyl-CoA decarboxylase subunit gamma